MRIFIVLIKSPDGDNEIEIAISEIHAKNIINDYQRYQTYKNHTFEIIEKCLDLDDWRILCR